jgi:shikimate dehydrogenase
MRLTAIRREAKAATVRAENEKRFRALAHISLCTWRRVPYKHGVSELSARSIDAGTRYCAVYGHPVRHSASPAMQNAGLAALGLNWRYLGFDVHPESLPSAIAGAQAMNFIGLNLTVPHKLLALDIVDALDDSAKLWGSVNTVRFEAQGEQGEWKPLGEFANAPRKVRSRGFNTDAEAVARALREDLQFESRGKTVLLLGAGGAGRTAALKLASAGVAQLFLVNRTQSKAETVAKEIGRLYPEVMLDLGYPPGKVDLALNATSLGLRPDDPLPFAETHFALHDAAAVFDMIYRPAETPFIKLAQAAGCRTANGLGMLLHQGARALELWTGQPAPTAIMREALQKNVYG